MDITRSQKYIFDIMEDNFDENTNVSAIPNILDYLRNKTKRLQNFKFPNFKTVLKCVREKISMNKSPKKIKYIRLFTEKETRY